MTGTPAARAAIAVTAALAGVIGYRSLSATATGTPAFFAVLAGCAILYGVIVWALCVRTIAPSMAVAGVLALALVARLPLLGEDIGDKSDLYRYLWDARVVRAGLNPYTLIPQAPEAAWLHTADTRRMNNPDVPSPYPPAAQLFFVLVTTFTESARGFKWALALCDAGVIAALLVWLKTTRRSPAWAVVYAWHPLVIVETARSGHLDVAGVLVLVGAAVAAARASMGAATVLLAVAAAFKILPAVLAPLFWRRARPRHALAAALLVGVLYLPFLRHGLPSVGSVADVVQRFRFNSPVFNLLEWIVPAWGLAGLAVIAGLVMAWRQSRRSLQDPAAWAWPLAVTLLLSPLVYPWYLVWLVPFLTTRATLALSVWALSICSTFVVWAAAESGAPWRVPVWALIIEYGALASALAWQAMRTEPPHEASSAMPPGLNQGNPSPR